MTAPTRPAPRSLRRLEGVGIGCDGDPPTSRALFPRRISGCCAPRFCITSFLSERKTPSCLQTGRVVREAGLPGAGVSRFPDVSCNLLALLRTRSTRRPTLFTFIRYQACMRMHLSESVDESGKHFGAEITTPSLTVTADRLEQPPVKTDAAPHVLLT